MSSKATTPESQKKTKIFIYGSLLTGEPAENRVKVVYRMHAVLKTPALLFNLGNFPALVTDIPAKCTDTPVTGIVGEVISVYPEELQQLDRYEGCHEGNEANNLYNRKEVEIEVEGETVKAVAYVMTYEKASKHGIAFKKVCDWRDRFLETLPDTASEEAKSFVRGKGSENHIVTSILSLALKTVVSLAKELKSSDTLTTTSHRDDIKLVGELTEYFLK